MRTGGRLNRTGYIRQPLFRALDGHMPPAARPAREGKGSLNHRSERSPFTRGRFDNAGSRHTQAVENLNVCQHSLQGTG